VTAHILPRTGWAFITATEENKTIKILSIGDSITDGYGTEGSYRKFLYKNLTDKGYSVDMTGPNNSWGDGQYSDAGESFSYDAAHCGFSGYSICEYSGRNGILETISKGKYLEEYVPDIVILQIGTNDIIDNYDIDNAGERLDTLVSYILGNISEDSALFVTTVPYLAPNEPDVYQWFLNYRHSADWTQQFNDEEAEKAVISQVDNYNRQVSELVSRKQSEGVKNIFAGDINSVLDDLKLQLKDGVHPNDTGYRLMGEYWTNLLTDYLAENSEPDNKAEKGDANSDGSVTATDIVLLQNRLLGLTDTENISEGADMNDDGKINILDLILLKNLLLR
jgi:lysophospholipase L1-like esterase